jgi:hypothetical protein
MEGVFCRAWLDFSDARRGAFVWIKIRSSVDAASIVACL